MKNKITYEIILSDESKDFKIKLYSDPSDWKNIDLSELINRARVLGKKYIKCVRIDFYIKDIELLRSLEVYEELYNGSTWCYNLFLNKEDFDENEKAKEEHFIKCLCSFGPLIEKLVGPMG